MFNKALQQCCVYACMLHGSGVFTYTCTLRGRQLAARTGKAAAGVPVMLSCPGGSSSQVDAGNKKGLNKADAKGHVAACSCVSSHADAARSQVCNTTRMPACQPFWAS
jgi:hypothetical protein